MSNIEELWPKNTLRQMQIRLHDGTMDHDGQPRVQFMDSVPRRRLAQLGSSHGVVA